MGSTGEKGGSEDGAGGSGTVTPARDADRMTSSGEPGATVTLRGSASRMAEALMLKPVWLNPPSGVLPLTSRSSLTASLPCGSSTTPARTP
jgi:hypothetical protein